MENIIPPTEWNERLTKENEFRLLIFFPFWGRIFSLWWKIVSHKVKIFYHKGTVFCPHIFLYILRYSAKGKILSVWRTIFTHQRIQIYFNGVIQLRSVNRTWIFTRTESDWGIHRLHLSDPFVGSLQVKILIFFMYFR